MPRAILPLHELKRVVRRRRAWGIDRKDEVWDGVYVMASPLDNDHYQLNFLLYIALLSALSRSEDVRVQAGGNVSDQDGKWTKNYRCPDLLVFLPNCPAENRGTHYLGGPDFVVEIVSRGDRSRKKLDFYAKVGVRELLLIDRNPWKLELYRLDQGKLNLVGVQNVDDPRPLQSEVLPVSLQLTSGPSRPEIVITRNGGEWRA
jgi:Uma2 family endonuclease